MSETTARLGLPLIQPGQAQKELSHNEALALLDMVAQPTAVAVGANAPPAASAPGQCWIVGANPTGAWSGQANALAGWTDGGWRFVAPILGMTVWTGGANGSVRWDGSGWVTGVLDAAVLKIGGVQVVGARGAAIPDPAGGANVDPETRAALIAILAILRQHGLIGP